MIDPAIYAPAAEIGRTLLWCVLIVSSLLIFKQPISTFLVNIKEAKAGPFGLSSFQSQELATGKGDEPPDPNADVKDPIDRVAFENEAATAPPALQKRVNELTEAYNQVYAAWYHERTYNVIYGSQIAALIMAENHALSEQRLRSLYEQSRRLGNKQPFEAWVAFLIDRGLLVRGGQAGNTITPTGLAFLAYVRAQNLPITKLW